MNTKIVAASQIIKEEGMVRLVRESLAHLDRRFNRETTNTRFGEHKRNLQAKKNLTIAEIGVWRGYHASLLLNNLDIKKIYLIDPYDAYDEYEEAKSENNEVKLAKRIAHKNLGNKENVEWIEEYSHEAVSEIEDDLDYVYIDGNHGYEYVKRDIEIYYELLGEDGILAGHDVDQDGVAKALIEFSSKNDIVPNFEKENSDWYVSKD